ncbi:MULTISPECIES: hypothetical protein [Flavobacterium]|jgi:hypothetical protein|uniref:Uncharacterized protein n=1 Tax=Flavobacterium johnsoniae (strain ATCC 17061 / DSM 2064 / JCM 8514 / BCRC 14874 / CCUG 350202 / NBRC 14942 / NCIMB 11054 / UW101) TaxID=376686 RepID=A5FNK8_FLAJ1|nr:MULTISPECIES: hypothetical protein [Flavobacterium]ABQ03209.1 hypothetical protein Fjoh_0172 [Flavobacterium johnsoniae UW101]OXG01366.1 hypothetical protein B0A63_07655 [Flavobacterium johnsoniae UW101]WDF58963.1 hypothetical protein PQ462_19870 [Flavobacterium sp. KACC 22758]WQG79928.1 hypothetical protein SR927_18095 [Flavobacterium johnsoniae UW101]SHL82060.1 hypothetical protein SAMN05444146_4699 [Flavobacterium johnsoniae]
MYQIILCEKATGIILELDGKTRYSYDGINDFPPTFFASLEEAEDKADALLKENNTIEIQICNTDGSRVKIMA